MRDLSPPPRELQALSEVAATRVAPAAARALLALLVALPLLWWGLEIGAGGLLSGGGIFAGAFSGPLPQGARAANRELAARLSALEDRIDRESVASSAVRPPVQALLTGLLGAGNERAYPGRGGEVYFREDVDHLTGPPFLAKPAGFGGHRVAAAGPAAARAADPRPAIRELHEFLAARGIPLLLLPVPVKPAIHPEGLARGAVEPPLRNRSEAALFAELAADGIELLDPAPLLAARAAAGHRTYLRGDSHWRPEAVELVAAAVARRLREMADLPAPGLVLRRVEGRASAVGDSVALLGLPSWARLFAPEEVSVRRVVGEDGVAWRSRGDAPVLLLGDSFANVFASADLGWGEGAGLAEQLACELGIPVDRIARNAGGAHASRAELARAIVRGEEPLAGVRAVVWQFATRELSQGDWELLGLESLPSGADGAAGAPPQGAWASGRIRAVAPSSVAADAPYREALGALEVELAGAPAVVYVWVRRDGEATALARLRAGSEVELRLRPWEEVAGDLDAVQRFELAGEAWWSWPVFLAEEVR
ncbi:MAG: hypothetical protein M5U13_08995 [Thermoanaerobaculia bacterium]|nr:hypothetical protein [Thermoanaerobaculia bacterium]